MKKRIIAIILTVIMSIFGFYRVLLSMPSAKGMDFMLVMGTNLLLLGIAAVLLIIALMLKNSAKTKNNIVYLYVTLATGYMLFGLMVAPQNELLSQEKQYERLIEIFGSEKELVSEIDEKFREKNSDSKLELVKGTYSEEELEFAADEKVAMKKVFFEYEYNFETKYMDEDVKGNVHLSFECAPKRKSVTCEVSNKTFNGVTLKNGDALPQKVEWSLRTVNMFYEKF
ncbi:hypothetical protein MKX47_11100 [Solibacillus sp. FSL R7-0668]|uniref:hypothetical protein n=1 Tax=Solibacillus sp. FSL R7-0668 TaxID=2921688 RepID=UPI0030F5F71A